jgi:hypothetical protein
MKILNDRIIKDGMILPVEILINDDKPIRVTDDYIDISYKSMETESRILSNLYPYKFDYFGNISSSIEAVIQSLKYENSEIRKTCLDYYGIDAYHLRGITPFDWQKTGMLYAYKPINRFSEEYQNFLDELYFLAYQNPIFKNNLICSKNKKLDHTIGEDDPHKTTLTRTEYISRLYALRYCAINEINEKKEINNILRSVRGELING